MAISTRTVGILGGMGPAAGADFLRLFVLACETQLRKRGVPITDQAFPEHWLVQAPIPDRTAALQATGTARDAPLAPMIGALARLEGLGATAVAMACNTAHAWHGPLQQRCPGIELLHAPREVAARLRAGGHREAVLLATRGTYGTGLYEAALDAAGITCHRPDEAEQATLMRGIYTGVKAGDLDLAQRDFVAVATSLVRRHGRAPLIMGCTEIPLVLATAPEAADWILVNASAVLADALAARAYAEQKFAKP